MLNLNSNNTANYTDNQEYQLEFLTKIICDSWHYLLSVYEEIEISTEGGREEKLLKRGLVKGIQPLDDADKDAFEYGMDIVYNNQGRGTFKVKGRSDKLNLDEFLSFVEQGSEIRRLFQSSMLIPDGLILISDEGIVWKNSTAEQMLFRINFEELYDELLLENNQFKSPVVLVKSIVIETFELTLVKIPISTPEISLGSFVILADLSSKDEHYHKAVIKEIHHRVKNNLQTVAGLLGLQMKRVKSRTVERAFQESINRISSIALIHEELSKGGIEAINIKSTISNIMEMVLRTTVPPNKDIRGEVEGLDIFADANLVSMLSLCVTELLQNSVEHAFPLRKKGFISLKIEQSEGYITIVIEDDGIGYTKKRNKSSLGLEIIEMITSETLKGTFSIEGHMYGTQSTIKFPVV